MKKIIIKSYFTLLELFVSLAIIGIVGSFTTIKINKALNRHQFSSNIKRINNHIEYCKKMAITHQTDIFLTISSQEKGIECEIGTDEDHGIFKNQKRQQDFLKNIFFTFNDQNKEKIIIGFSSTGVSFPKGEIMLYDKQENYSENIKY